MKKLILSTIILTSLMACSQSKNQVMQNTNITADNIVTELAKEVNHFPSEPIYVMGYTNDMCFFETSINDMPVYREFKKMSGSGFNINSSVFRKGKYTVKYKLYPIGKYEDYNETYNNLIDETSLQLDLGSYDNRNTNSEDKKYINYETPKIETKVTPDYSTYKFEGSGKTYYEGSFDINIDVPYEIHPPFENAQDLSKMDKKELETKLLKEYNKIRNVYQNKEKDNIAKLVYDNLKTQSITNYSTKEQVKEAWDEINEILFKSDIEILPIENYKMQFFANGKLVALFTDGSNPKIRGGNALICNVKSGNHGKGFIELKHFFYIPQGETEFKVY